MALEAILLGQLNLEEHISKLPDSFLLKTNTQDPAVMSNPPFSRCVFPAPYYPDKGEGYSIPQVPPTHKLQTGVQREISDLP